MKKWPIFMVAFMISLLTSCGSADNIHTPSRSYIENVNRNAGTAEDPVFPEKYKDERVDPYNH